MKAIRIHKFGESEDVLQYEEVPVPEPNAGSVLTKSSGLAQARRYRLRQGTYRIAADALPVYRSRVCRTFAKLGARSATIMSVSARHRYPSLGCYAE